jgi:probable HAF family extracellular repeat protein
MIGKRDQAINSSGVVVGDSRDSANRAGLSLPIGLACIASPAPTGTAMAILRPVFRATRRSLLSRLVALMFILNTTSVVLAQATFTPLGLLGGQAWDVSADGSVVVGTVGNEVFRWTAGGTILRPASVQDRAAVSGDGRVVVGSQLFPDRGAFRWIIGQPFEDLGDLEATFDSGAFGASADGNVVVGYGSTNNGTMAFRWTPATGMVSLGDLPGGGNDDSAATGVSADGAVVVGYGEGTDSRRQTIRWTAATGMVGLGLLPEADGGSARAVSADGSVVVGANAFETTPQNPFTTTLQAFRWAAAEGMVGLGDLPGGRFFSEAYDVSADGSAVVGYSEVGVRGGMPISAAFYWTAAIGMVNLQDALVSAGVSNLDGWTLQRAHGVSADGLTIVGTGDHNGRTEPWVATIPEPSTIALAAAGAAGFLGFYLRAKRRKCIDSGLSGG